MSQNPNDLRNDDAAVRAAVRFGAVVSVVAVAFVLGAAGFLSTCGPGAVDTAACGAPERLFLALGAPAILLIGGLWAFARTYRAWRRYETWWPWQGAGWFLLTLMLFILVASLPALAGPAL